MINVKADPDGEEYETQCACCGRPIYWGYGWLSSGETSLAAYWYQWSEGHQGRFCLAVARFDEDDCLIPGVACVSGRLQSGSIHYSILNPEDSPWESFGSFGPPADRATALEEKGEIFSLIDLITANENRISSRIIASGLQS
jgi:hypothetical protein